METVCTTVYGGMGVRHELQNIGIVAHSSMQVSVDHTRYPTRSASVEGTGQRVPGAQARV